MKYKIGQVLYAVMRKENKVQPIQVIEEITKRTLRGEELTYIVSLGPGGPPSPVNLADIHAEVFESAEQATDVLTKRVVDAVKKMVEVAESRAREWYPSANQFRVPVVQSHSEQIDDETFVELPDGTKARVRNLNG